MEKPNSEIKYPISPNVLIDYLNTAFVYYVYKGTNSVSISTEPYETADSPNPSEENTITIEDDKMLDEKAVKLLLDKLNLSISDFEEYLKSKL